MAVQSTVSSRFCLFCPLGFRKYSCFVEFLLSPMLAAARHLSLLHAPSHLWFCVEDDIWSNIWRNDWHYSDVISPSRRDFCWFLLPPDTWWCWLFRILWLQVQSLHFHALRILDLWLSWAPGSWILPESPSFPGCSPSLGRLWVCRVTVFVGSVGPQLAWGPSLGSPH